MYHVTIRHWTADARIPLVRILRQFAGSDLKTAKEQMESFLDDESLTLPMGSTSQVCEFVCAALDIGICQISIDLQTE